MGCWVRTPMVSGPLAVYASGFEEWLRARGYARVTICERLLQFGRLSCWLEREGLVVGELTPERAVMFRAWCREAGAPKWMWGESRP